MCIDFGKINYDIDYLLISIKEEMVFGLYLLIEVVILCLNVVCVLYEEWFLVKSILMLFLK